jgi:hypothetical protein
MSDPKKTSPRKLLGIDTDAALKIGAARGSDRERDAAGTAAGCRAPALPPRRAAAEIDRLADRRGCGFRGMGAARDLMPGGDEPGVGRLLGGEHLQPALAVLVEVVGNLCGLLAVLGLPDALADRGHSRLLSMIYNE